MNFVWYSLGMPAVKRIMTTALWKCFKGKDYDHTEGAMAEMATSAADQIKSLIRGESFTAKV